MLYRLLFSVFLSLVCFSARAEEAVDTIRSLGEVEVTATVMRDIIPARSLDGETLQKLNSQSVADALRYFSGVQIKDFGGIGGVKTVNIRNMGSQHVGVFYDGIQLGNAQNGQIDLGKYSLDNIEEIKLYNGQRSDIFQSARDYGSSGTIYITTKRPGWSGSESTHITAQLRGGSFGLVNPELVWEQRLSQSVSLSASAAWTHANGRYKFHYRRLNTDGSVAYDTTATRHGGDVDALRGEISLFGFHGAMRWSGKAYYYDSERGIPGAIVNNVFKNGERQWDRNFFLQASALMPFSSRYSLRLSGKWALDYMHFLRDDPRELYINNRYYQQELYFSAANLFHIAPKWDVSASADLQWNRMNSDLAGFVFPRRVTTMVSGATAVTDLGGLNAQASVLATMVHDTTRETGSSSMTDWTPALFLSWRPSSLRQLTVNAFAKKAFRMPTFNDLYYTEIGNKYLKPERTTQFDLGAAYNKNFAHTFFKQISLQVDGYYNRVTDKIVAYPSGQQFRWTMLNLGKVKVWGVDASASLRAAVGECSMHLLLNYTWQRATDVTDPADSYYGHLIPYSPVHSGSVSAGVSWHGIDVNYSFIYTGKRYSAQENTLRNLEQPWYTSDASIFYNFTLRRCRARAGVEINNIFDQAYEVVRNYPMPGRNFKLLLRVEI